MLPLIWGSLLCWGLLPLAHGRAMHHLNMRISVCVLETEIKDLFSEHRVLERMAGLPLRGAPSDGAEPLGSLPFVKDRFSKNGGTLQLSLLGDLLSEDSSSLLPQLLQSGGLLEIKEVKALKVTVRILDGSLLQVTLRCKLYVTLAKLLSVEIIKNIRVGVRLDQMGGQTQIALEECHTPPGYLSIRLLDEPNFQGPNQVLKMVTDTLDEALPFILQKIVCPLATDLLNMLLQGFLRAASPAREEDFQYYVTTTQLTEDAILMDVVLVTPCGYKTPRQNHQEPRPLPSLAQDSLADLVFNLETYNGILSCLSTSKGTHMNLYSFEAAELSQLLSQTYLEPGPQVSDQCRGNVRLAIRVPEPPAFSPDSDAVIQYGSLMLLGPCNKSVSVPWMLLTEPHFILEDEKLVLQSHPTRTQFLMNSYLDDSTKQVNPEKTSLANLLKKDFLPLYNGQLRNENSLPLPHMKGVDFNKANVIVSKDGVVVTVPKD